MGLTGQEEVLGKSVITETSRISALREYGVLDTNPQKEFDDLTRLAAELCDAPVARINLIDTRRQWSKAIFGSDPSKTEIPRSSSVCQYTILGDEVLEINDLQKDPRFSEMAYVKGDPYLRYYLGAPLLTPGGFAIGALCVLDYKPRKMGDKQKGQLETLANEVMARFELQKKNRELESLNEHKVNLMKMLSHDMRSPINGIIGMSNLLASELQESSQLEMAALLEQSAIQLNQMVDEIMSYSLIESRGFKLSAEEVDLSAIVTSLDRLYQPVAKSKGVDLVFRNEISQNVRLDKSKFEQVFGNLLSNSLKFTNTGGKVSSELRIEESESRKYLKLVVKDTGIGMNGEKASQLFGNKDVQSTSGTAGEKSTGLGLSIIKYFVELHSGNIDLNSKLGEGTEFVITIPLANT
jgi:two-component system, sensor histidine kinase